MTHEIVEEPSALRGAMLDPERSAGVGTLFNYIANEKNPFESRRTVLELLGNIDKLGDQGKDILRELNVTALINGGLTSESIAKVLEQHSIE